MEVEAADVGSDRHHVAHGVLVDDTLLNVVDLRALHTWRRREYTLSGLHRNHSGGGEEGTSLSLSLLALARMVPLFKCF